MVLPGGNPTNTVDAVHTPASALKYKDVVSGSSLLSTGLHAPGYGLGGLGSSSGGAGGGGGGQLRYVDDYRTLNQFRKRSAGDQSIISIRIDEDDSGEELEERRLGVEEELANQGPEVDDEDVDDIDVQDTDVDVNERTPLNVKSSSSDENRKSCTSDDDDAQRRASLSRARTSMSYEQEQIQQQQQQRQQSSSPLTASELTQQRRRSSMKRNDTDDSEVDFICEVDTDDSEVVRRVDRIFDEIDYSVTESIDESKLMTSHSSADASSYNPGVGSIDDSRDAACGTSSSATSRTETATRRASFKVEARV